VQTITFIIAVLALVIALAAFQRTGGIEDLRRQVETLTSKTEKARDRTANLFDRFEKFIRGKENSPPPKKEGAPSPFK
jgi:hypothetical protein|tara:strand:- start:249 stop:482 length:234 start_codon:yes stop_codon:yes gene_type:complete